MKKIAVFPGSFDPVTRGHESVIRRAIPLFDKIIVALGENSQKQGYFPVSQRIQWLEMVFSGDATVEIKTYSGLTVDFCRKEGIRYIIRGLRASADFEFERGIALMNRQMHREIETIFILSDPEFSAVSSSIVREIHRFGGDISIFLPDCLRDVFKV